MVSSAATTEEASAASDALERELDAARALALAEERDEKEEKSEKGETSSNPVAGAKSDEKATKTRT